MPSPASFIFIFWARFRGGFFSFSVPTSYYHLRCPRKPEVKLVNRKRGRLFIFTERLKTYCLYRGSVCTLKMYGAVARSCVLCSVSDAHFVPRVAEREKERGRDGKIKEEVN
ncbi:uncharacterized [Tachysurus ichikawai]